MSQFDGDEYQKQLKRLELLQQKKLLRDGLPHLNRWKNYRWAREFIESTNRMNLLCAANQISKSSSAIRKNILFATEQTLWKKAWDTRPNFFWYIYPDKNKIEEEWRKWELEFLPQKGFENHKKYGYTVEYFQKGIPKTIFFKSGVVLTFKTWNMDLQSGTLHMVTCDEELPAELYPELQQRLSRYDGIFNMVFTATLNQPYWFDAIEKIGKPGERFKEAAKWQISKYDCQFYEDGTPGPWTPQKIARDIQMCGSEAEVQRRVFGRFVSEVGLKYPAFSRTKNVKEPMKIPSDWLWFAGVDYGSGGTAHKSAITLLAVRPDYKYARVVRCWKGPEGVDTTSGDVVEKYQEMTKGLDITGVFYDWNAKDLATYATRAGLPFEKAEKGHDIGEDTINTLFKNGMLDIDDTEENQDLISELCFLKKETRKQSANDDATDSMRYSVTKIPWDFSDITGDLFAMPEKAKKIKTEVEQRRAFALNLDDEDESQEVWDPDGEIAFWNDMY